MSVVGRTSFWRPAGNWKGESARMEAHGFYENLAKFAFRPFFSAAVSISAGGCEAKPVGRLFRQARTSNAFFCPVPCAGI